MNRSKFFSEKKKKLYYAALIAVLVIAAFLGYTLEKKKVPARVAFATKGGGVVFNHQLHVSLKDSKCVECHHNYEAGEKDASFKDMKCRDCHYSKECAEICEDAAIHKRCIGRNCMNCHVQGTVQCDFCHNAESFKKIEQPKKVEFTTDGGPVVFDHFLHASEDGAGLECDTCHHGYKKEDNSFASNCRRCHYNKKYESLCEDADTHVRCIGKNCIDCHEDGKEDCTICHKEE